jgi:hypothetical protein
MTDAKRAEQVARDNILKLLSNEEVAKVSTAEAASGLTEGGEYMVALGRGKWHSTSEDESSYPRSASKPHGSLASSQSFRA